MRNRPNHVVLQEAASVIEKLKDHLETQGNSDPNACRELLSQARAWLYEWERINEHNSRMTFVL